tara:strand:+ start:11324 stop:12172 length:849 start_codon:yes stop_codon:yes gene_type:complete
MRGEPIMNTNKLKSFASLVLVITSISALANTQTLNAPKSLSELINKDRFGLAASSYNSTIGTTDNIDGVSQLNIVNLYYTISDKDSLRWQNQVTGTFQKDVDTNFTHAKTILKYTRSGILNQEEHGLNMSAAFEKRYITDPSARVDGNAYGHNRLSTSFSRKVNDKFSLGATMFLALNDIRDSKVKTTTRNYFLGILSQSLSLPKNLSLTFFQEVFKANNSIDLDESASMTFNVDLSGSATEKLGYNFTVYSTPLSGKDNLKYQDDFYENLTYEFGLNYRAF